MQVDKETFRRLSGGTLNDALFDAHAIGGVITRDKLIELSSTTDCFLSLQWTNDCFNRSIPDRVKRMCNGLQARGLTACFEQHSKAEDIVSSVCNGIDKARCICVFLTQGYLNSVHGTNAMDTCLMEYGFASRRKNPDHIVVVVMESALRDPGKWGNMLGPKLGNRPFVDFSDDANFEQACGDLFQRILYVMRTMHNQLGDGGNENFNDNHSHSSVGGISAHFDAAAREETQFSQWMARSTKISENKRIVYCASLVRLGVTSVQKLAKKMNEVPNFLTSLGVTEFDADEIALAVSDLGLGYQPVRDFSGATSIDSASYALKKCTQAPDDHALAANAFACICRIAQSSAEMPKKLMDLGFGEAIIKVMIGHLGDASCVENACKCLVVIASYSPELNDLLGSGLACVMIPKATQSHLNNPVVVQHTCDIIALLATSPLNRAKLGISGACDVVVKALNLHLNYVEVSEKACTCFSNLSHNHFENIGKLGIAGAVDVVSRCLSIHYTSPVVAEQSFKTICLLAQDPDIRTAWGLSVPDALVAAMTAHIDNPEIVQHGCYAINQIIVGHAFNRKLMGQKGSCQVVRAALERHYNHPGLALYGCIAAYGLAGGSPENQAQFNGIGPLLKLIASNPNMPERTRQEAKEASTKMR